MQLGIKKTTTVVVGGGSRVVGQGRFKGLLQHTELLVNPGWLR